MNPLIILTALAWVWDWRYGSKKKEEGRTECLTRCVYELDKEYHENEKLTGTEAPTSMEHIRELIEPCERKCSR